MFAREREGAQLYPCDISGIDWLRGICRFQIAMNDALLVRRFQGFGDLFGDWQGFVERDRSLLDAVRQRRPFDEFEDQRPDALSLLQPVDAPNVGVVQRGEHVGFTLEAGQPVWVGRERLRQDLERHVAVEFLSRA